MAYWSSIPVGGSVRDVLNLSQIPVIICREELDPSTTTTALVMKSVDGCLEPSRWSTLGKAWILQFGHNAREPQKERVSQHERELSTAKLKLLLYVQQQEFGSESCALQQGLPLSKGSSFRKLSPFVGKDGLLRIQGRLQLSGQPYDARHPIIVPKGHVAVLLARQVHQVMKHAGVNAMLVTLRN